MNFNKLVKERISPILHRKDFIIIEELKNIIRFQSSNIEINIIFNSYEQSCYVSIGKTGESLYELRNNAVKKFFNSSLSVEQVTPEVFVQNLSFLFQTKEGISLLKGGINDFIKFKTAEAHNYTFELIKRQVLEAASRAWEANEYLVFIENIDRIGISKVPKEYQLKYKIAIKRL